MMSIPKFTLIAVLALAATSASAADRIRLAVQRTGTLSWELAVLRAHGLDKKADLQIDALELASPEAGKIAIKGGSADMFLATMFNQGKPENSALNRLAVFPPQKQVS